MSASLSVSLPGSEAAAADASARGDVTASNGDGARLLRASGDDEEDEGEEVAADEVEATEVDQSE